MGVTRTKRLLALLAVGAVMLPACGGSSDGGSADTTASGGDAAETTVATDESSETTDGSASTTVADSSGGSDTTDASTATTVADPGESDSGNPPGWAGELVFRTTESSTMDPAKLSVESSQDFDRTAAIFDTLLLWQADGDIVPQLAESMETTDGVVWTLKLRPDINFTDGTPLDAEAVKFNLDRQMDPANACGCAGNLADVASIEIIDPLTIEFTLNEANGTFMEGFSGINGMIGSPTAIKADPEGFAIAPVGAGAYTLTEYVRDDHVLLTRNPDYWDPSAPAYETVRMRFIPDPVASAEAIRNGEVDVAFSGGVAMLTQLGDAESLGYYVERADGMDFVLMNNSEGPTADIRIREAISLAFDPARVNAALLGGLWTDEELVCPPFVASDPECVPGIWPSFNPERSAELVAEYAAEGNSVDLTLFGPTTQQAALEFIQQTLNGIGLNVTIDVVPGAEWITAVNAGDFQITWYAVGVPVNARMDYLFRSSQRNIIQADSPAYDEAVLTARTATDAAERLAAWETMQQVLADEFLIAWYAPFINGYVLRSDIDYGDQVRTVKLHISQLAPKE